MVDVPARDGETLRAHIERHGQILAHRREAERITQKMNIEKQLNRKVEWNCELRIINQKLTNLNNPKWRSHDR
jgi:hypothetical protein